MKPDLKDQVRNYLHNKMDEKEKRAFDLKIRSDPDFREEVREQIRMIESAGRAEIRQMAEEAYDEEEDKRRKKRKDTFSGLGVAAGLLLIFSLLLIFILPKSVEPEELFSEYYEFPVLSLRSGDEDSVWNSVMESYLPGPGQDFEKALKGFEFVLADSALALKYADMAHFYVGICLLETDRAAEAVKEFDAVDSNAVGIWVEADWYEALASLRLEEIGTICGRIEKIIQNNSFGAKERGNAIELKRDLKCSSFSKLTVLKNYE